MFHCWRAVIRPSSGVRLTAASMLVLLVTTAVAQAQDFCPAIDVLIEQSHSQFAEILDKPANTSGDYNVTLSLADASHCSVTKRSKRSWYSCRWDFPYRATQAYQTYDAFVERMSGCIGQRATMHSDQSVNHPDYYDLRRFELTQADVSVSVKDKAALENTFVFIRVQGKRQK